MSDFPFYRQLDSMDCGPTCLRIIAKFYGKDFSTQSLRKATGISRSGVSLLALSQAAEKIGLNANGVLIPLEQLIKELHSPCIVHWDQNHFVVVYKINRNKLYVSDPARGLLVYTLEEFCAHWIGTCEGQEKSGIALLLELSKELTQEITEENKHYGFKKLFGFLSSYKNIIIQLFFGLLSGTLIQLIIPFLTRSIVDTGINNKNINFIYLVVLAQIALLISRFAVEFIRSWIILYLSVRINLSILTDFFIKLMRLPVVFFESKLFGDIVQRINDQRRIENFVTSVSLEVLFSSFNVITFGIVLLLFNRTIFAIFFFSSLLYSLWVILFLKRRRALDTERFKTQIMEQNSIYEIINGMQEIKLANAELYKRWQWESIRLKVFKLNSQALALNQYQLAGVHVINEGKNILIAFLAAKFVIDNQMTLGTMISIQYIVAQLNSPIEQIIVFIQSFQEAKISLERISEIHEMDDEQNQFDKVVPFSNICQDVTVRNLSFSYKAVEEKLVLKNINLKIKTGNVLAIVGDSGSGKSTLMRLLLKFYTPTNGVIYFGDNNLDSISHQQWRDNCGVVSQDSFIFSDSIINNIAVGVESINRKQLSHAIKVANIEDFINELPMGLDTKIGQEGNGISQGQKQRILIARAVYKNPNFIFFDEATNALDANNENIIVKNLDLFFKGRTVIIIAHRLSTIKNADQIVVLEGGYLIEQGSHNELLRKKGKYYELIKSQL